MSGLHLTPVMTIHTGFVQVLMHIGDHR